uniref:E3 ubiquitin-protein ligase TRIM39-like n=1 Tax=Sinocyclocheilus anshuiensis TaxID=1608454 RepID=A0A671PCH9_9TELE
RYLASSSGPLTEELQCSVCLDVFTNPVTTPCRHNFCKSCLNQCWDKSEDCSCPFCKETFSKRPDLKINTALRQVVQHFKEKSDVQQMIQGRMKKIQDIKHSGELRKQSMEKEKAGSIELFTALMLSIEKCQAELLEKMEEKQKAAEEQEEEPIEELQQEQLSHTEDHLQLIQQWTDISVNTPVSLNTIRAALTELQQTLDEKLSETELKRMRLYAVDVTLDPDTAQPELILSDDGKQVSNGDIKHDVPDNLKRFDHCIFILGKEVFSSGRFYFEVQVMKKTAWNLGVARESVTRKGRITLRPQNGYWAIRLRNGNKYKALVNSMSVLSPRVKPQKVGVFVDYEEGLVSFYDVETRSHIYSFTGQTFNGKRYPYFCPALNNDGKNSDPLIISPVN